jgi:hypothetical protein
VENEKRLEKWSIGVRHTYEISSSKHQITNKSQIPILNDQNRFGIWNFGHWDLFEICDLEFLFLQYSKKPRLVE